MIEETPKIDETLFPSEKAGLPIVKTTQDIVGNIPFHQHTGTDGSPKVVLNNVNNKEDSEGGKYRSVDSGTSFDTNSASYVSITGMTRTFTQKIGARRYLLLFSCSLANTTASAETSLTFNIDGTDKAVLGYHKPQDSSFTSLTMHYATDQLDYGSHTFIARVKTTAGTASLSNMNFSIIEITN